MKFVKMGAAQCTVSEAEKSESGICHYCVHCGHCQSPCKMLHIVLYWNGLSWIRLGMLITKLFKITPFPFVCQQNVISSSHEYNNMSTFEQYHEKITAVLPHSDTALIWCCTIVFGLQNRVSGGIIIPRLNKDSSMTKTGLN